MPWMRRLTSIGWCVVRMPIYVMLVALEPVMRFLLLVLTVVGILMSLFFYLAGAPHFPLWRMLAISLSFGLALLGYYILCAVVAPSPREY